MCDIELVNAPRYRSSIVPDMLQVPSISLARNKTNSTDREFQLHLFHFIFTYIQ